MTDWIAIGIVVAADLIAWTILGWHRRETRKERPDPSADRHISFPESQLKWADPPAGRRPVQGSCPSCGAGEKHYCAMDCQLLDPCQPH